jgi:hypothetical protein
MTALDNPRSENLVISLTGYWSASSLQTLSVPSWESSSTTTISVRMSAPFTASHIRRISSGRLSASRKVGTTTTNSGSILVRDAFTEFLLEEDRIFVTAADQNAVEAPLKRTAHHGRQNKGPIIYP